MRLSPIRITPLVRWLAAALVAAPLMAVASEGLALINTAGEQRMLTQRVVKAYAQLGLNVQPLAAKSQLDDTIRRFESNQARLGPALAAYPDAAAALALLNRAWSEMRPLASGAPTLAGAQKLSQYSETALNAAEMLVNVLADSAKLDTDRVLRMAARQRMLSQRIAKAYMLRSWGDSTAVVRYELDDGIAAFDGVLTVLSSREGDTNATRRELEELTLQWEWLKAALESDGALSYRLVISESADAILASADRLTQHYQRQLAVRQP